MTDIFGVDLPNQNALNPNIRGILHEVGTIFVGTLAFFVVELISLLLHPLIGIFVYLFFAGYLLFKVDFTIPELRPLKAKFIQLLGDMIVTIICNIVITFIKESMTDDYLRRNVDMFYVVPKISVLMIVLHIFIVARIFIFKRVAQITMDVIIELWNYLKSLFN